MIRDGGVRVTLRFARAILIASAIVGIGPAAGAAQAGPGRPAVDSLLAAGRLQEAAWVAREAGDTATADSILTRLESILRLPPVEARPLSIDSQGVSYTWHLVHPGGVASIFKVDGSDVFCRSCGTDREVAAYRMDRLLGLDLTPMTVPTTVTTPRDTMAGSAMYYVAGAPNAAEAGARKPDLLRFFDAIMGNSDRHRTNWLVLPDGRIVAIDHNRTFQFRPAGTPKTCWETEVDSIARPGRLGEPYRRYRTLPAESLRAALKGLDPTLVERFVAMRDRVVDRIEDRIEEPRERLAHRDCVFEDQEQGR